MAFQYASNRDLFELKQEGTLRAGLESRTPIGFPSRSQKSTGCCRRSKIDYREGGIPPRTVYYRVPRSVMPVTLQCLLTG